MQITQTAGKNRRTMQTKHVATGHIASIQAEGSGLMLHIKTGDGEIFLVQVTAEELLKLHTFQAIAA
jgi:hypothetical protein